MFWLCALLSKLVVLGHSKPKEETTPKTKEQPTVDALLVLLMLAALLGPSAALADEQSKLVLDLRQYMTEDQSVQLVHLGIFDKEGMTNVYALKDDRGLFLAHGDHLWDLDGGWRLGPSLVWKRGGDVQASVVADWSGKVVGGNAYCWVQLRTPWPKGMAQIVLDPLQLTWPIGAGITAGVRSTIVLTSGQKPFVGIGPTISTTLGKNTTLDAHYYPGVGELRLQLVHKL